MFSDQLLGELAWKLSNTMDVGFCVETLKEALARFGAPEIFNTDQGAQFTSFDFTAGYGTPKSGSAWMVGAAGWTMSSSSGCGGR